MNRSLRQRLILVALLSPMLVSVSGVTFTCEKTGDTTLRLFRFEAPPGISRIAVFDPDVRAYDLWLPVNTTTALVRGESTDSGSQISYNIQGADGFIEGGFVGIGAGEVTINLTGVERILVFVKAPGKATNNYIVYINPPCPTGEVCSDGGTPGTCSNNVCQAGPVPEGSILVNGDFNQCAQLQAVLPAATTLQAALEAEIDLEAQATDDEGHTIDYQWSATSGLLTNATTPTTTYTCSPTGAHVIRLSISDDGFNDCIEDWSMVVLCGDTTLCEGVVCDDGNQCTIDVCDPADGACVFPLQSNGAFCDFGGLPGECQSGTCVGLCDDAATRCSDANECTLDNCDGLTGSCSNPNLADGSSCDFDGYQGACMAGTCELLPPDLLLYAAQSAPAARFESVFDGPAGPRQPIQSYPAAFSAVFPTFATDGLLWTNNAQGWGTNLARYDMNTGARVGCYRLGYANGNCDAPAGQLSGSWTLSPLVATHVSGNVYGHVGYVPNMTQFNGFGDQSGQRYDLVRVTVTGAWQGVVPTGSCGGSPALSSIGHMAALPPDSSDPSKEEFYVLAGTGPPPKQRWIAKLGVSPPSCQVVARLDGGGGNGSPQLSITAAEWMRRLRVAADGTIFFLLRPPSGTYNDDGIWRLGDTNGDGTINASDQLQLVVAHDGTNPALGHNIMDFAIGPHDGHLYVHVQKTSGTGPYARVDVYAADGFAGQPALGSFDLQTDYGDDLSGAIEMFPLQ